MAKSRGGRSLLSALALAACLCMCMPTFVPGPSGVVRPEDSWLRAPAAASAALPALTLLADNAEAAYGDSRRWSAVLVPFTGLVVPAVAAVAFVLYSFSDDFAWQIRYDSKRNMAREKAWMSHPAFKDRQDPFAGLVSQSDYERGLKQAWEKAKPIGSTVTVEDKLKDLSTQNNPHYWRNRVKNEQSA